ncbi:MAG: FxsA family protein [Candidatus Brocadiales bacterium]|nr:FxsA family protein [Candidatus Bathyanammoxibius sp.]MCQ4574852.1 FxsA family protein [Candidatus Bathyanammoxibius amoris]
MFLRLFLLFTIVPLIELYLLLKLGGYIGAVATVGVVIGTGIAGGLLAKSQGLAVLRQAQGELDLGRIPAESLFDGALILLAATMLITPGLITDCLGLLLLIPWTRRRFKSWLRRKLEEKISRGEIRVYTHFGDFGGDRGSV